MGQSTARLTKILPWRDSQRPGNFWRTSANSSGSTMGDPNQLVSFGTSGRRRDQHERD
jgi:hypothetical protein